MRRDASLRGGGSPNQLREREARFRDLAEASLDGIVVQVAGVVVEANSAFHALAGRPREGVVGARVLDLVAPEDRARVEGIIARRDESPYETRLLRPDGSTRIVEVRARECTFEGKAARIVAVRDVTRLRADEERLRRSEAMGRAILDSISASIAVLDRSGVIVAVNHAWERFAATNGGRPGASVGADYGAVCERAGATEAWSGIRDVLEGRRSLFLLEYRCDAPDERRWF